MSDVVCWQPKAEYDYRRDGVVLWWKPNPAEDERPYVGTDHDMLFKRAYTWWTPLPRPPADIGPKVPTGPSAMRDKRR